MSSRLPLPDPRSLLKGMQIAKFDGKQITPMVEKKK